MRITYAATNRAHHYPYARELHRQGLLHAFISGFSRLSPRAAFPEIGEKLKRRDLFQTLYVISLKAGLPKKVVDALNVLSNAYIDKSCYPFAAESDVFLYYRTVGRRTAQRLKREGRPVMCVLEEVNSHVSLCHQIMKEEYLSLEIGDTPESFPDMPSRLQAYEEADYILCSSEWVRRSFIQKGFPAEKLLKNPYGFNLIEQDASLPESSKGAEKKPSFQILYVGQIHYRKGLRYLVDAFSKLKHPDKELVIVGPKTTVTGLENTVMPPNVRFTGELKGNDLAAAYKSASIFCLPSLEEGLALVMGEALSFGLPIIATNQTGAEDLFEDGKQGWIVDPKDSDALLQCMQKLADDEGLLARMSNAAITHSKLLGGWESSGTKLAETLAQAHRSWLAERPNA